jgi:hypothetical protein
MAGLLLSIAGAAAEAELTLSDEERHELVRWSRRATSAQALALRARIVLAEPDATNKDVAARLRVAPNTVGKWRRRSRIGLDGRRRSVWIR